eukprot:CAMPEP_0206397168 /NCGR_PEP_ID=MMETSP0294-20121207/23272_1 /ASSEMBLY_ACC=CAM_ASM_000327 /TAXON_ID=39354 /ORGANISM="Heterosigma akashiwo, Strain CCMP2393" /LENGTH=284 /DNA_ID=CAMNT_0053852143 /DNA_START=759 /DNA_END=1615 /DNA_ORIENTATION=+
MAARPKTHRLEQEAQQLAGGCTIRRGAAPLATLQQSATAKPPAQDPLTESYPPGHQQTTQQTTARGLAHTLPAVLKPSSGLLDPAPTPLGISKKLEPVPVLPTYVSDERASPDNHLKRHSSLTESQKAHETSMKPPFIHSWESGGATLSGGMTMLGSGGGMEESSEQVPVQAKTVVDTAAAKKVSSAAGAVEKELQTKTKPSIISVVIGDDVVIAQGVREDGRKLTSLTAGPAGRVAIITTNLASLGLVADPDESDLIGSSAAPQRGLPQWGWLSRQPPPPGHD